MWEAKEEWSERSADSPAGGPPRNDTDTEMKGTDQPGPTTRGQHVAGTGLTKPDCTAALRDDQLSSTAMSILRALLPFRHGGASAEGRLLSSGRILLSVSKE